MSAPDIFLSYNREDSERAKQFAEGFAAAGLDVWWDVALRSGEAYDEVTEAALRNARAVVVLWSQKSVVSRWVRAEATLAERKKTLMPAMIEPCERPIMFELTQTADLSHWQGDTADKGWCDFARHVCEFVGKEAKASPASDKAEEPIPSLAQISLVVLPFANMGGDPEQEYFADGITEDIITDLSKVSALMVISRNSAFTFKGKHVDLPEVARQLGVSHVLEGSVRKAGNRVRVTAQLIDGKTNGHLWADRYDRDLDDIFALQDELSQEIVKALRVKLLPREKKAIETRETTSLAAYDKFLRARAAAAVARDGDGYAAALDLYRQALAIDPEFKLALSSMALVLWLMATYAPERQEQIEQEFEALTAQAHLLAPGEWVTYWLEGIQNSRGQNWFGALTALEMAIAHAPTPDSDLTMTYGLSLAGLGRSDEAIKVLETMRASDPLSPNVSATLQMLYFIDGQDQASLAEYERGNSLLVTGEGREHAATFLAYATGDMAAFKAQFRRFLDNRAVPTPFLDRCLEVLDQPAAALAILREAFDDPANHDGTRMMAIAIHAGLHGGPDLAVAALQIMTDLDFPVRYIIWWPSLREARKLPAFKALLRKNGVYDCWRASGHWGKFARPLGDDDFEIIA